jgi:hypothetical protein
MVVFTVAMVYWFLCFMCTGIWIELIAPEEVRSLAWMLGNFFKQVAWVGVAWLVLFWAMTLISSLPV